MPGAQQRERGNIFTLGARDSAMRTDQPEVEVTETTESFQQADEDKKAVTEAAATTPEQMVQDEDADQTDAQATEVSLDQTNFDAEATKVGETITNPKVKTVFDDIIDEVKALSIDDTEGGFYPMSKPGELMQLRDQLTTEINSYEDKIADIAQENKSRSWKV